MNDMLREFTSYGQFLIPLLTVKHEIEPERVQWGDKLQYFLHYTPPERKSDVIVIYIHGGGWNSNEAKTFHFIGQFFAQSGYECVLLNYRKVPKVHYAEIVSDVFAGFCEVRKRLSAKQNTQYIIIGSSAGISPNGKVEITTSSSFARCCTITGTPSASHQTVPSESASSCSPAASANSVISFSNSIRRHPPPYNGT